MLRNTTNRLAEQAKVARATTSKTISVYWHTIVSENKEGAITPDQISQQMDTVNKDFADSGITFKLVASDTTVNSDWFSKMVKYFTPEETEMKIALHKGGPGDLNVYTAQLTGYLGYTTVPEAYASQPKNDGTILDYRTLPGGPWGKANSLGRTATHEFGHWLGLFHVFEGGCDGKSGDYVDDTPPQKASHTGCQTDLPASCPGSAHDLVRNFMDYSDDDCVDSFTPGQIARMHQIGSALRGL
ncbi:hypothetical protein OC861_001072 [Tilletia horrida]|nr:hypothetical protein OC861_001072 [Tilletia horrida]